MTPAEIERVARALQDHARKNGIVKTWREYAEVAIMVMSGAEEMRERAARAAEERADGREQLYRENQAPINAYKAVEAREIAAAIRALPLETIVSSGQSNTIYDDFDWEIGHG